MARLGKGSLLAVLVAQVLFLGWASDRPSSWEAHAKDFRVKFVVMTTTGQQSFTVRVHRDWAPIAAQRFEDLVRSNFFDDSRFFRVIEDDIYQFGARGHPSLSTHEDWEDLKAEKHPANNLRGRLAFASSGPNTRSTQIFINLADDAGNQDLDKEGFAPFAELEEGGIAVVKTIFAYGEKPLRGKGWSRIQKEGNAYLDQRYPKMSQIVRAELLREVTVQVKERKSEF